jgi:PAS domain-containing protein
VKTEQRHLAPEALVTLASYAGDWTVLLDHSGRIVYELGSCAALFGGEEKTVSIGRRITAFVHAEDMTVAADKMADSLSEVGSQIAFEIRAGLGEASYRTVDVLAVNCFHDRFLNGVILRVTGRAD